MLSQQSRGADEDGRHREAVRAVGKDLTGGHVSENEWLKVRHGCRGLLFLARGDATMRSRRAGDRTKKAARLSLAHAAPDSILSLFITDSSISQPETGNKGAADTGSAVPAD